jgi:hypothetical protein
LDKSESEYIREVFMSVILNEVKNLS